MSAPIRRVFCDLDGCLVNFTREAAARYGVEYPREALLPDGWLDEACGDRGWVRCRGMAFWFNLKPFPWARAIHDMVAAHTDEWVYLTKPTNDPDCYGGKHMWVQHHFKDANARLWIVNGDKSMVCRGPSDMIIDDKLKTIAAWRAAGGTPFHWQEMTQDYPPSLVRARLSALKAALEGRS